MNNRKDIKFVLKKAIINIDNGFFNSRNLGFYS